MTTPSITEHSIDVAGQALSYLKAGSGPAVVIIHGIGGRKEDWQGLVADLAATHAVYAFDMIGFGASGKTAPTITIAQQAEAAAALLDHEAIARASLVGNSLGAWVATTFAVANPARVDRLVLSDAAGLKVTLSGPPPVNFAPDTVDEMHQLLSTVMLSPFARTRPFAEQALAAFKSSGEAKTLGKLFAGFADPHSPDKPLDDLLPLVKAPALVVWGAQDGLFPVALADVVAAGIAGARKQLIANASHFPQIDNPVDFNAAVRGFLA